MVIVLFKVKVQAIAKNYVLLFSDCGQLQEVSMWFPSGCYNKAQNWFKERLHLFGIVGFVIVSVQVSLFCTKSAFIIFSTLYQGFFFKYRFLD